MKNVFLCIIFQYGFFTTNLSGQYIPLVEENKYWFYNTNDGGDIPHTISGYLIFFKNDTIINGNIYMKVRLAGLIGTYDNCQFPPCFKPNFPYELFGSNIIGYVREDTVLQVVYFMPVQTNNEACEDGEVEIYNFKLSVKDTIPYCKFRQLFEKYWGNNPDKFGVIDSVYTTYSYDKNRKHLVFKGPYLFYGLPHVAEMNIIEGIGSEYYNPFLNLPNTLFVSFCEGTLEQCNIISTTQNESPKSQRQIQLIPNPSNDLVSFHLNNATRQHVNQYLIRDLQGRIIKDKSSINESGESTISTLEFSSGMYIIQFLKDGKLIDAQKLVISH